MTDAELRSLERLCSKDDLSDSNVASLTALGLSAASEVRRLRGLLDEACDIAEAAAYNHDRPRNYWDDRLAQLRKAGT